MLKASAITSGTTVKRSAVEREDLKPYYITEKYHIFQGDQQVYLQGFQRVSLRQKEVLKGGSLKRQTSPHAI